MGEVPSENGPTVATYRPYGGPPDDPPDLLWPSRLKRGPRSLKLVYLDLNHWVGLANAAARLATGSNYRELLDACREALSRRSVNFPLSGTHYMEIAKIVDPSRRANLACVMEELSGFVTLLPRDLVAGLEVEEGLDRIFGPSTAVPTMDFVGWGAQHSVGYAGGIRIVDSSGADVIENARARVGTDVFDEMLAYARLTLEREILRGPQNEEEIAQLRARGWRPDAAVEVARARADRENDLVRMLNEDPDWRRGRLRDVVSAREIIWEFWDDFAKRLVERGITNLSFLDDLQRIRVFIRSMPTAEVAIEMKTACHRNPSKVWDTKSIFDVDAMALTVPYCDAVVTEKHAWTILTKARLNERMDTAVMKTPAQLIEWLATNT